MKLVVGLGNPEKQYEETRHNIGFKIVSALASEAFTHSAKHKADISQSSSVVFAKPTTFMNNSGQAVSSLASFYKVKPSDLFLIYDDLDIPLGEYKIVKGKGPRIHNGVASVEEKLGTSDFWHVRVGVEGRLPKSRGVVGGIKAMLASRDSRNIPGEKYVLMPFRKEEKTKVEEVIRTVVEEVKSRLVD